MMPGTAAFFLLLAPFFVRADVDIVFSQKGPDIEAILTGSLKTDGYTKRADSPNLKGTTRVSSSFVQFTNADDTFDVYWHNAGEPVEGSFDSCTGGTANSNADGIFYFIYNTKNQAAFYLERDYVSESALTTIVGFVKDQTIASFFGTEAGFPCSVTFPTGALPGETQSINIRLAPPTPSPTDIPTASPTEVPSQLPSETPSENPTYGPTTSPTKTPTKAPAKFPTSGPTADPTTSQTKTPTKAPTKNPTMIPTFTATAATTAPPDDVPSDTITITGFVRVRFWCPGNSIDQSDVDEVGAVVCNHIAGHLKWIYYPRDISMPVCTWEVQGRYRSPLRMIFRFEAVIDIGTERSSGLKIDDAVEDAFLGNVGVDLIEDLHELTDSNPLSATSGVELDDSPAACSMVPAFLAWIPILGDIVNAVLCFLFGPAGLISRF